MAESKITKNSPKWNSVMGTGIAGGGTGTHPAIDGFVRVARDTRQNVLICVYDGAHAGIITDNGTDPGKITASVSNGTLTISNGSGYSVVVYYYY